MKPVRHTSTTRIFGAPVDWDHSKGPVEALPISDTEVDGLPLMLSFWKAELEDLIALNGGGRLVLSVVGDTMPPVALSTTPAPAARLEAQAYARDVKLPEPDLLNGAHRLDALERINGWSENQVREILAKALIAIVGAP